jgi:hypothetical protein
MEVAPRMLTSRRNRFGILGIEGLPPGRQQTGANYFHLDTDGAADHPESVED